MARHGGLEANRIGMSLSMIAVLRNPPQGQVRDNAAGFRRASRSGPAAGDRQPRRRHACIQVRLSGAPYRYLKSAKKTA